MPRLQKALAAAGVASRRACEEMISSGRVQVNGVTVIKLGTRVDPVNDMILVDGEPIGPDSSISPLYILLNKPVGVTSTVSDPHAERTVMELLTQVPSRVYPVGRLDVDTAGLLILTNDGEFANRVTHPRYHVPKVYRIRARGFVTREEAQRLAEGVELPDGRTSPAELKFVDYDPGSQSTILEMTLYEGRNRQVRRMLDAVGHPVRDLTRIAYGSVRLKDLAPGTWRKLSAIEVERLLALAKPTPTPPKAERRAKLPYRPRNAPPRPTEMEVE